jgi:hypothetical protein
LRGESFATQRDAVAAAKAHLQVLGGELEVKTRNGRVRRETVARTQPAASNSAERIGVRQSWTRLNYAQRLGLLFVGIISLSGAVNGALVITEFASRAIANVTARHGPTVLESPWTGLQIWQSGTQIPLFTGVDQGNSHPILTADLEPSPFEMRFPIGIAKVGAEVCAAKDPTAFEVMEGTEEAVDPTVIGTSDDIYEQTRCLGWKRGMARAPYNTNIILATDANNYLRDQALRPVNDRSLAVDFSTIALSRRDVEPVAIGDFHGSLYLLVFIDQDNDEHVDNDEYEYVELAF